MSTKGTNGSRYKILIFISVCFDASIINHHNSRQIESQSSSCQLGIAAERKQKNRFFVLIKKFNLDEFLKLGDYKNLKPYKLRYRILIYFKYIRKNNLINNIKL